MKFITAVFLVLSSLSFSLQDNAKVVGDWSGKIVTPNGDLEVIIHLTEKENKLMASMDSPMQGAYDIAMDNASFKDGVLKMSMQAIDGSYEGTLKDGKINGKWSQSGMSMDLVLEKVKKK